MSDATLTVVGIGADGWRGLGEQAREAVLSATLLVGSKRQLELVPATPAERRPWPSPIDSLLEELVAGTTGPTCILASGDPMLYGIGATLARRVDPARLVVHPQVSAFALACARLGWPQAETELLTTVGRPVEAIARFLQPGRRLVLFVSGAGAVSEIARILRGNGLGPSRLAVLESLGGSDERIVESTADDWGEQPVEALHVVGVECRAGADVRPRPRT
ncbi:MAG: precorrin-6y C5,15-methyltransferase (decarboxylating) subunit CbiE, partial [Gaiellaceae bacterium]